jgi:ADP-heptose:LPS heptosyltransferase
MSRILVIQMAKLGDFIQSTPFLAALRSTWPGRTVTSAGVAPAVLAAARLSPLVEETLAIGPGRPGPEDEFEAVFDLNSAPAAAHLAAKIRADQRFGPTAEGETAAGGTLSFTPVQEFLMGLMAEDRRLGRFNLADVWLALAPEAGPRPLFWPPPERVPRGPDLRIGLHLGAKNHLRRWPVENFVSLARTLSGGEFILTGSAGEKALGAKFEKLLGAKFEKPRPSILNLMGATDLSELSRVLAGLDLLVTADTGVLHLAAAVRTPVLALFFGPAYGPETGPYGPGHLIYQAGAPCGPCREGSCRLRQCLALPDPDLAARLADHFMAPPLADQPPTTPLPPGHRVWRTGTDAFGQRLEPLGRPALTSEEALALALTWVGQSVLRPGFQARPTDLSEWAAAYAPPSGRLVLAEGRFRRLSGRLSPEVRANLVRGLEVLGLEIADT